MLPAVAAVLPDGRRSGLLRRSSRTRGRKLWAPSCPSSAALLPATLTLLPRTGLRSSGAAAMGAASHTNCEVSFSSPPPAALLGWLADALLALLSEVKGRRGMPCEASERLEAAGRCRASLNRFAAFTCRGCAAKHSGVARGKKNSQRCWTGKAAQY